jgi:DNA-binding protein HU-beta
MNKSQLVDTLADRLGDRKTAATAVDALLQIVVDTVRSGDTVSLAGFGVFESRARAARTGRNPRTGESVAVPATTVPAFRPGTGFRNAVAGEGAADAAEPAAATFAEEPAAVEAPAPAPPRRRRRAASATNGSGDGASLNGAVDLSAVPTTTLLAEPPAAADEKAAAKKPSAKKATAKKAAAKKAEPKVDAKPAPKADTKASAKSATKADTKPAPKADAKKGKAGKKAKKGK